MSFQYKYRDLKLGQEYDYSADTNGRGSVGEIGSKPYGIPINVVVTEPPTILRRIFTSYGFLSVSSTSPYHYISADKNAELLVRRLYYRDS